MNTTIVRTTTIMVAVMLAATLLARDYESANGIRRTTGRPAAAAGTAKAAPCSPSTAQTELSLNNVRALLTTGGLLWYNRPQGQSAYEVPQTEDRSGARAIYAGGLWMGGLSPDNQLKLAAVRYREGNDFWPGPLTTTGDASVTSEVCVRYDRFFENDRKDAERHEAYYRCQADPNCDLNTEFPDPYVVPTSYFEWPAINNDPGYDTYLAPFIDWNGDGDYNPTDGDYPAFELGSETGDCRKRREDPLPLFGDYNIWWVFNDKGNQHTETGGQPIGMEIRAQAFAFSTNDEVNNMTFYNYLLINRGTQTLTNTYFGQYADADLGCADDDFAGCDVKRGLGFVYNWDDDDQSCQGAPGYGPQPPAVGIDFFEGPFQDYDEVDNPGELQGLSCNEYIEQGGVPYKGIGIGYGDGAIDNERFGMRAYIYYNRQGPNAVTDPTLAIHYYNYLRSIWKDGTPQTYAGGSTPGYDPSNPNAVPAFYMFPGDSDPVGWGTGCVPQAPWQEAAQTNVDRRFVQSAGPFTLEPGAYNNITVGVVWARATAGGAFASVEELRRADDKAQALFDNCFRILDGPDAPNLRIQELDKELIIYLENPLGSNNFKEEYAELDPTIPEDADDRFYRFQGYKVYQVANAEVSVAELDDVSKARLVAVCDLPDSVGQLVNWIQNQDINLPVPTEMVNAPDTGVFHSLRVTQDLFAIGDPRMVNYKTYHFIAIAYGYNNWQDYDVATLTGQPFPFKAGRKAAAGSIRSYAGIPHPPASELGGTIQNSQYGDQFAVTRIEGQGNGGLVIDLDPATRNEILAAPTARVDQIKYRKGLGPVRVKVVDPLNVPNAEFELWFKDSTDLPSPSDYKDYEELNDAYWLLVRINPEGQTNADTVRADRTIEVGNEQLIPAWGISVAIDQTGYANSDGFTAPLDDVIENTPRAGQQSTLWYSVISDRDGETPFNWIRSGTADDDAITYKDYVGVDDGEQYERFAEGGWAPWPLVGDTAFQPGALAVRSTILSADISECSSVEVVFTSDKANWTRCPVLEETELPLQAFPSGTKKLTMRNTASVDKNGRRSGTPGCDENEAQLTSAVSMGWFPGYAIDLETGERLNMAFGEDGFWGGERGRDMVWNPTDQIATNLGDPLMAGGHWIYVYKNRRRMQNDDQQMPHYDNGQFIFDKLNGDQAVNRTKVWRACMWVGSAALVQGTSFLPIEQGLIPSDIRVRLNVNKPYLTYLPYEGQPSPGVNIDRNGGLPLYTFSTAGSQTVTEVNQVQTDELDAIGVVPNPYYAFSGYESSRLDNRVKFINLPRTCTISIYSVNGTLIRQYRKDNELTFLDWDLKNSKSVPIAGGTYICHIDVPGSGERVLKWFGVMRPVDLQNF